MPHLCRDGREGSEFLNHGIPEVPAVLMPCRDAQNNRPIYTCDRVSGEFLKAWSLCTYIDDADSTVITLVLRFGKTKSERN